MTTIATETITPGPTAAARQIVMIVNMLTSGGAEKQMLWIAETLAGERYDVVILELMAPSGLSRIDALVARASARGVSFHRARRGDGYLRALWRLQALRRVRPRSVFWTWGLRADLLVSLSRLLPSQPEHPWLCSLRNANSGAIWSYRRLYRWMNRGVTLYVANTHSNCDMLEDVCPGALARCRVLPNVSEELDEDSLQLPSKVPEPLRLVMLGNIDVLRKGYDIMIEIARLIKRDGVPAEIHIAGRQNSEAWLERQIDLHGLEKVVIYHGETTRPLEFLRHGHAYMLLSRHEGMPNAMLEALALGLPTIASKVGDLERMAGDHKPYHLVDIGATDAVLAAIKAMLVDWEGAVVLGRQGRAWCEHNFSSANCRRRLLSILDEAVRNLPLEGGRP